MTRIAYQQIRRARQQVTGLERMESLAGIVTSGCNLDQFTLAYKEL